MAELTAREIASFLESRTRQGILLRSNADGTANGTPVWFDWDGTAIRVFTGATSPKVRAIERDPRVSMLVINDLDEPPMWVRFDGNALIDRDADAQALATDVLAPRYWDTTDPKIRETLEQWRAAPADFFVVIVLEPNRVRSSVG
ncbi:MAG: pyridoxamine 5'-phosphate oxidase family protein [Actinomycetota bacterium]